MTNQIKISARTKALLQEMQKEMGESQMAILEQALLAYYRKWRMHKDADFPL